MDKPVEIETRAVVGTVESRAQGEKMTVAGYAVVFGERADIGGMFTEVIERGAFTKTLKTADVRAYYGHDRNRVLGRSSAGTLRLKQDTKGLAVEIDLPDTTDGRDARELIARGDVSGMSFGFRVLREKWDEAGNVSLRRVQEIELLEVSVVSEPAYGGTSVALRSMEAAREGAQRFDAAAYRRRVLLKLDLRLRG